MAFALVESVTAIVMLGIRDVLILTATHNMFLKRLLVEPAALNNPPPRTCLNLHPLPSVG